MNLTEIQRTLHGLGMYHGKIDGVDGPKTQAAVMAFQAMYPPLVVDGIAGKRTLARLFPEAPVKGIKGFPWSNVGTKLDDYDIPRIGHRIGVGEDEIRAVLDVETRGTGFDSNGVIRLFEEHVFYRQLPKLSRQNAVAAGLAWPKWRSNYKDNYQKLLAAYTFDPHAALMSCSWGLGQVMGFNHNLAGYDTVEDMIKSFAESEANQLEGMVEFIVVAGLDDELRAHDWAGFARGYNGKGYRKNKYDERLNSRFKFWQSKPDVVWSPGDNNE